MSAASDATRAGIAVRVLVVSHGFQQAYERGYCSALAANGVEVVLAASDRTDTARLHRGVDARNLRGSQAEDRPRLVKALNLLRYHLRLLLLAFTERFEVIHVIGIPSPLTLLCEGVLLRLATRCYALTIHNILPHDRHTRLRAWLARLGYRLPQRLVVHTQRMADTLVAEYGIARERIEVMEHGCEIDLDLPPAPFVPAAEGTLRILFFGTVSPFKGIDVLLEAVDGLERRWQLDIIGRCRDPLLERSLRAQIARMRHGASVHWRNEFVDEGEIPGIMARADLIVLPYRHIDQSGVLFLAMRHGLPVVATRVGEFARYLPFPSGELCEPDDADGLRAAIAALAQRLPTVSRDEISARATAQFDWRSTVQPLLMRLFETRRAAPGPSPARRLMVVDLSVLPTSPAGSCVLAQLDGLADRLSICLFAADCDEALRQRVHWVRVPAPRRPLVLRYPVFQVGVLCRYALWRLRHRRADVIQSTQGQFIGAEIVYAHFCHRAYLRGPWRSSPVSGIRRLARWVNHRWNEWTEALAFARARRIVVPSQGLAREITACYPQCAAKLDVLANPVDEARFAPPPGFDRLAQRAALGLPAGARVFAFMALGDFARKGLDVVLDALVLLDDRERDAMRVLVIGGQPAEIASYQARASERGVGQLVVFAGFHRDPRPFLWCADVFCFPSAYEIFSLAILQAAAAGLPVIVTRELYGAEEFVEDGRNGWTVTRDAQGVLVALRRALASETDLAEMSRAARVSIARYSVASFVERWSKVYGVG